MNRAKLLMICLLALAGTSAYLSMNHSSPSVQARLSTLQHHVMKAATVLHTTDQERVIGPPTISASFINQLLCSFHSPACGTGQAFFDLGRQYGIDPVYALAFFWHESRFGTAGEARVTHSIGNLRCIPTARCIDQERGGYAAFDSWGDGIRAWYALIHDLYVGQWQRDTVAAIIPRYAPGADHNDETAYIASVTAAVTLWRSGKVALP